MSKRAGRCFNQDEIDNLPKERRQDLMCATCGAWITEFYIAQIDAHVPELKETFRCRVCGDETVVESVAVLLDISVGPGRKAAEIEMEEAETRSKLRDALAALRSQWFLNPVKPSFSLKCKLSNHFWRVVAREKGNTSDGLRYDNLNGTMAECGRCGKRHDDLKGEVGWVLPYAANEGEIYL